MESSACVCECDAVWFLKHSKLLRASLLLFSFFIFHFKRWEMLYSSSLCYSIHLFSNSSNRIWGMMCSFRHFLFIFFLQTVFCTAFIACRIFVCRFIIIWKLSRLKLATQSQLNTYLLYANSLQRNTNKQTKNDNIDEKTDALYCILLRIILYVYCLLHVLSFALHFCRV